jgi:hypothetical protein
MRYACAIAGLVVGVAWAATALAASPESAPPRSSELDCRACWQALWDRTGSQQELLLRLGLRAQALDVSERQWLVGQAKACFAASLRIDVAEDRNLFSGGNESLRNGLLALLTKIGSPVGPDDLGAMLPRGANLQALDPERLQSSAFVRFAHERWDAGCTRALTLALVDREVVENPSWFLAIAWLGYHVMPEAEFPLLRSAFDKAYFKRDRLLSEAEIASLDGPLSAPRWNLDPARTARDYAYDNMAEHVFRSLEQGSPAAKGPLQPSAYLRLAARYKSPVDWSRTLAGHLKTPTKRNARAMFLLKLFVDLPGEHFTPLAELVRDDPEFFVFLHRGRADEGLGPWNVLNAKSKDNLVGSMAILKDFFRPECQKQWSVPLLSLLVLEYYSHDVPGPESLFVSVLMPIAAAARGIPADHPVRGDLLQKICEGSFPEDWQQRWALAWAAAGDQPLKGVVSVGEGKRSAIEFLTTVCVGIPVSGAPAAEVPVRVKQTYVRLLNHVFDRLFATRPPDASPSDEAVLAALTRLFGQLAKFRTEFGWKGEDDVAQRFWDRMEEEFTVAARDKSRERMTSILHLMLRICGVVGDLDPVERLADRICNKVFGVTPDTRFRVLSEKELALQADLFREIAPSIHEAIRAGRAIAAPEQVDRVIGKFLAGLYLPLMRTDRFMAQVGGKDDNLWLQLVNCYQDADERSAAMQAMVAELGHLKYLNSPVQVRSLIERLLGDKEGTPCQPQDLDLSENVNLPLVKNLLDERHEDFEADASSLEDVLRLFDDHLREDALWITSCVYDASGQRTTVTHLDRSRLLPYLVGLLMLYEALPDVAPFIGADAKPFDPVLEGQYEYSPETGPKFVLPKKGSPWERSWRRLNIPGRLRLELLRAMAGLRGPDDLDYRLALAAVAMMLPNNPDHVAEADRDNLAEYARVKQETVDKLEKALTRPIPNQTRFRILLTLTRLRFAFGDDPKEPSAAFREGLKDLASGEGGGALVRSLVYEDYFLRLSNSPPNATAAGISGHVKDLLKLLAKECPGAASFGDPYFLAVQLQNRAREAPKFLEKVSSADVVAFSRLLGLLEGAELSDSSGREAGCTILWAFALALPYYGLTPDSLLPPTGEATTGTPDAERKARQSLDALILMGQLSPEAKKKLADWAEESESAPPDDEFPEGSRRLLRQLLIEHNNMAILMAGMVFENRALLCQASKTQHYIAETIDFRILYQAQVPVELSSQRLLDGALNGAALNFRLAEREGGDGEAVFGFLFTGNGQWRPGQRSPYTPSIDATLRTCARVATDPRYEGETEVAVREAAMKFQKSAQAFVAKPIALDWFCNPGRTRFKTPLMYLRVCEIAGERILSEKHWPAWDLPQDTEGHTRATKWARDARDLHARLWCSTLFGPEGDPPWKPAFIELFCAPLAPPPSPAAPDQAESTSPPDSEKPAPAPKPPDPLEVQRRLMETVVEGEVVGTTPGPEDERRLRGLHVTLRLMDEELKRDPDSPAAAYLKTQWECVRSLLHAAQLGLGLPEGGEPRFLARCFMEAPGGVARALTEDEIEEAAQGTGLFDAIDWPSRWDRKYQEDTRLQEIIGQPFAKQFGQARKGRGLGGMDLQPDGAKPASYRHAVWLAMTRHIAGRLRPVMANLDRVNRAGSPESLVVSPAARTEVLRNLSSIIAFRLAHGERLRAMAERSGRALAEGPSAVSSSEYWSWLDADATTIGWTKGLVTKDMWAFLAPLWAPFAAYAGLDDAAKFFEPEALGVSAAMWEGTRDRDIRENALIQLLGVAEVRYGSVPEIRVSPAVEQAYGEVLRGEPRLKAPKNDAAACAGKITRWTAMDNWLPLLEKSYAVDVCGMPHQNGVPYERERAGCFLAIASEAVHRVPRVALGEEALNLCHWTALPQQEWRREWMARYARKMQFVISCGDLALPAEGTAEWAPALSALKCLACRAEPCASPYLPKEGGADRLLLVAPREGWQLKDIDRLDPKSRRRALESLKSWCVLQRAVCRDGTLETLKAGFMGYVDLLQSDAQHMAGPERSAKERP